VPISGQVSGLGSITVGGAYSYSISFSGATDGMAREHHHYLYDDPSNPNGPMEGMPEDETWMVADHQTVNFSGSVSQFGTSLNLNGNVRVSDHAAWLWALDHLDPNDARHHVVPLQGTTGVTLDLSILAGISDPVV